MKHSIHINIRNIVCAALAFLLVPALPTGWLYKSVQQLTEREETTWI